MLSTSEQTLTNTETPSQNSLDLAFLLDCTGSMQAYINMSRDQIKDIITDINIQTGQSELQLLDTGMLKIRSASRSSISQSR